MQMSLRRALFFISPQAINVAFLAQRFSINKKLWENKNVKNAFFILK